MATLSQVKAAQPEWFSRKNKRFFGDVNYRILHSRPEGKPYLVRATYQWSDMFGQTRTLRYRVNPLRDDLTIAPLVEQAFSDLDAVKEWLNS